MCEALGSISSTLHTSQKVNTREQNSVIQGIFIPGAILPNRKVPWEMALGGGIVVKGSQFKEQLGLPLFSSFPIHVNHLSRLSLASFQSHWSLTEHLLNKSAQGRKRKTNPGPTATFIYEKCLFHTTLLTEGSRSDSTARGFPHKCLVNTGEGGLTRIALAQHFNGSGHLLLTDPLILLPLGGSLQPLPGERAQVEVHQHVPQRLQVIPSRLFWKEKGTMSRKACMSVYV